MNVNLLNVIKEIVEENGESVLSDPSSSGARKRKHALDKKTSLGYFNNRKG